MKLGRMVFKPVVVLSDDFLQRQNEEDNECGHGGHWYLLINGGVAQREIHPSSSAVSRTWRISIKTCHFFLSVWIFEGILVVLVRWVAILGVVQQVFAKSDQWNGRLGSLLQRGKAPFLQGIELKEGQGQCWDVGAQHPGWESREISAVLSWSPLLWDPFICSR